MLGQQGLVATHQLLISHSGADISHSVRNLGLIRVVTQSLPDSKTFVLAQNILRSKQSTGDSQPCGDHAPRQFKPSPASLVTHGVLEPGPFPTHITKPSTEMGWGAADKSAGYSILVASMQIIIFTIQRSLGICHRPARLWARDQGQHFPWRVSQASASKQAPSPRRDPHTPLPEGHKLLCSASSPLPPWGRQSGDSHPWTGGP